jgi:uncharacterized protein YjiS (DUF1127 family)
MTTLAQPQSPFSLQTAQSPQLAAYGNLLSWLIAKICFELEVRRAMREVQSFDDQMLRDIGLPRGGIEHALRHGVMDASAEVTLRR